MTLDILSILSPPILILIASFIVLMIIVVTLIVINRRLKRAVKIGETNLEKEAKTRQEINLLRNSNDFPEKILNDLSNIARNFLYDAFKLKKNADYYELMQAFKDKKRMEIYSFCKKMTDILYSGEKVRKETVNSLIEEFNFIYEEEYPKMLMQNKIKEVKIKTEYHDNEAERYAHELSKVNETRVMEEYQNLQRKFESVYEHVKKLGTKEDLDRLEKIRKSLIISTNEYHKDKFKIIELAREIERSSKVLDLIMNRI